MIKGIIQLSVTDLDRNYSISGVTSESVIVISFVGMLTQEVTIGNQSYIDVIRGKMGQLKNYKEGTT